MKILFITQFFCPDIQATSQMFHELCEDLAKKHQVTVLCGTPLVTVGKDKPGDPDGADGLKIIRVFSFALTKKATFDRVINHLSFAVTSFLRLIAGVKADAVFFTSDNPLSFINLFFFRNKPKIYLCQDMYLEQGIAVGVYRKGLAKSLLSCSQKACLRAADKIIVIGARMKSYLEDKGVSPQKIEVIHNWADQDMILPCDQDNPFSREHGLVGKFVVMHSGRIGLTQDLELMIKCAAEMTEREDIVFVIVGDGVNKKNLVRMRDQKKLKNVLFLPYQAKTRLKYSLGASSVSVILEKQGLAGYLVPSRLYGIMSSARPVLATVDRNSEVYDIINEAGCGIAFSPGDLEGLKAAIFKLLYDNNLRISMGEKGRRYFLNNFARCSATSKYLNVVARLK